MSRNERLSIPTCLITQMHSVYHIALSHVTALVIGIPNIQDLKVIDWECKHLWIGLALSVLPLLFK